MREQLAEGLFLQYGNYLINLYGSLEGLARKFTVKLGLLLGTQSRDLLGKFHAGGGIALKHLVLDFRG